MSTLFRFTEVSVVLFEAFCVAEVFGRLGFRADQIQFLYARTDNPGAALLADRTTREDLCVCVMLTAPRRQEIVIWTDGQETSNVDAAEQLTFTIVVGPLPGSLAKRRLHDEGVAEEIVRLLTDAKKSITTAPLDEQQRVWRISRAASLMGNIERALKAKGFHVPRAA